MDTTGLNNSHPIGDLKEFQIFSYLINEEEKAKLRSDYIILASRVLARFFPWIEPLKDVVGNIEHRYSKEMGQKSMVVDLPVVPYNQSKHAGVIQYLEWIYKISLKGFSS